ncbi:MAG: hypothetical protein V3T65_07585 [Acidobacteriota bacterium]
MTRHIRMWPVLLMALIALILGGAALELRAADDEGEFDEFEVFIEINATDEDAGLQGKLDGPAWKKVEVEDANGKTIFKLKLQKALKKQGLTEIQWESDEPTFDEFSLADFLDRFPPGTYEAEGKTIEGYELESETELTHNIPAGPQNIELDFETNDDVVIVTWDQVVDDYRRPGYGDLASDIVGYGVVAECEDAEGELVKVVKRDVPGDPEEPETTLPADFFEDAFEDDLECKIEIGAIEESGNRTFEEMEVEEEE